jgi:GT2 family glycosyltransferase
MKPNIRITRSGRLLTQVRRRARHSARARDSDPGALVSVDAPDDEPLQVDTMLGAFLLMRRTMLDEIGGWDAGYKLYVEDIDLSYRAMKAGWERWWVPEAVVHHEYQAVIDKHFFTRRNLWHLQAMVRFLRKHPERLFALR